MFAITDQLAAQSLDNLINQMMPLFSTLISSAGALLMIASLLSGFVKYINGDGDPREIVSHLFGSFVIGSLTFGLSSLLDGSTRGNGDNTTPSSPFDSFPWKSIGIGLTITIIIIGTSLVAWHFSKPWREKRATEKSYQKAMREIWRLRSRIADGAFDEQGLDILNALAYIEDQLITFKIYRAEATNAEQLSFLRDVKPKLKDIISQFGNAWKDTAIENALNNIQFNQK